MFVVTGEIILKIKVPVTVVENTAWISSDNLPILSTIITEQILSSGEERDN